MSTLSERISQKLAEEIIAGRLAPGAKLDEQTLAARFKVSRTPVRDALRHLAATRLVESQPRRGFSVAVLELASLEDMFEAAGEVEALCARLCALRAGAAERKAIGRIHDQAHAAVAKDDSAEYSRLNEAFHRAIYAAARNKSLAAIALDLRQRLAPFRSRLFFNLANRMHSSSDEHDALARAIVDGDPDAASQAMREHAASSAMNAMEYFRRPAKSKSRPKARAKLRLRRVYKTGAVYTRMG